MPHAVPQPGPPPRQGSLPRHDPQREPPSNVRAGLVAPGVVANFSAATTSEGSRLRAACRNTACDYDEILLGAVERLTAGQRGRLKVLDRGSWAEDFQRVDQGV